MYIQGDIHNVIKTIESNSIDLIYTNPPFGITNKKWDKPLRWNELWKDIWRILKPKGIVLIHASKPFSYKLIQSQTPKYNYVWIKNNSTGFFNAKIQPLRKVEEIYVFYNDNHTYNPQMIGNKKYKKSKNYKNDYYGGRTGKQSTEIQIGRYPTDVLEYPIKIRGGKTIPDKMIEKFILTYLFNKYSKI